MSKDKKFNVLIVYDERVNIELAAAYLKELDNIKINYAENGKQAIQGIYTHDIDLVLLDINMPDIDGFEVCKLLKEDPKTKDIPVIFLTAQDSNEYITKAFEVGGVDYVGKPFNGEELKARVRTQLKIRAMIEELKDKQARLAQLSIIDPLTKACNTIFFKSKLKQFINEDQKFWLVHLYIESLDRVNSLLGHSRAEIILQEVAKILMECFYKTDIVARLYGTHFGVLAGGREKNELEKILFNVFQKINLSKEIPRDIKCIIVANVVKPHDTPYTLLERSHETLKKQKNNINSPFLIEV